MHPNNCQDFTSPHWGPWEFCVGMESEGGQATAEGIQLWAGLALWLCYAHHGRWRERAGTHQLREVVPPGHVVVSALVAHSGNPQV